MHAPAKYTLNLRGEHTVYKNALGTRLPGVTTVLGVLAKPPLIDWAARVEREKFAYLWAKEGMLCDADFDGPLAYTTQRDAAADIGTVAHARIHASLRGMELDEEGLPAEALDKSVNAWVRWHDWFVRERFDLVATEKPMVSESMQVGGTLDILADSPHGLTLIDIKTSKRPRPEDWPYDEMIGQVAAYRTIHDEGDGPRIARVCIFGVGKEQDDPGNVTWLTIGQLTAGEELFRGALAAYRAKNHLRGMR